MPLSDMANMDVDSASAPLTDAGSVESRSPSSEIAYYTPSSTTIRSRESNAPLQEAARGTDKEKAAVRVKEEPTAVQLQDVQPTAALVSTFSFRIPLGKFTYRLLADKRRPLFIL